MKSLVVEDDFTSSLLLQEILKKYGPCQTAVDGQKALEAVRAASESGTPFDLICLDIMMPEMDGHQALQQIRALEKAQGVLSPGGAKIIMTTALSDPKNVVEALSGLADAYLVKPIDKARLLDELRKLKLIE
ncbi:MAG: response regulator [Deltaproteobacteria bacterium]|nr:response regulator [Deltaproteobacteria bacterium]